MAAFWASFGGLRAAGAAPYMHCIPSHNCDSMGATGPCSCICALAHAEACACISCSNTAGSGGHGILMPFDRFFAFFGACRHTHAPMGGKAPCHPDECQIGHHASVRSGFSGFGQRHMDRPNCRFWAVWGLSGRRLHARATSKPQQRDGVGHMGP